MAHDLFIEKLKNAFSYDPEAGVVIRKIRLANRNKEGEEVGGIHKGHGYLVTRCFGKAMLVHRIAWAITYGKFPDGEIDHINGVRHDNRLNNLRDVPRRMNQLNQHGPRKDNSSGVLGVSYHKQIGKFQAYINESGQRKYLGCFSILSDAIKVRDTALKQIWERYKEEQENAA